MAVCPLLVPLTVKFKGFAVVDERPPRVSVLDPPAGIEVGLKPHDAPLLQVSTMGLKNVLGPDAEMVKVTLFEPIRMTLDRALEESVKTGLPVPVRVSAVIVFAAFDVTWTLPLAVPVAAGVKLTEMVQV